MDTLAMFPISAVLRLDIPALWCPCEYYDGYHPTEAIYHEDQYDRIYSHLTIKYLDIFESFHIRSVKMRSTTLIVGDGITWSGSHTKWGLLFLSSNSKSKVAWEGKGLFQLAWSQDRNSNRAGTWRQDLMRSPGTWRQDLMRSPWGRGVLCTDLLMQLVQLAFL